MSSRPSRSTLFPYTTLFRSVRTAIDTVFHEQSTQTLAELELDPNSEGSGRYVTLTVMKMRTEPGTPELAVIRSEEHTSELQSQSNLVCRLLLEKKNNQYRRK